MVGWMCLEMGDEPEKKDKIRKKSVVVKSLV